MIEHLLHAVGLVHHVSVEDEAIFIISPLPQSTLNRVNCLMSGCDGVSKHLLLQLKVSSLMTQYGYQDH